MSDSQLFVGLDVHRATIAVAVAEQGRTGEVRYVGNFPNRPTSIITQLKRFAERYGSIECVYEAGPCAYTLYRKLIAAGIRCMVVAPSKLPLAKGRVKNDHRDAVALARLLRAGDMVPIWVPDPTHEAMRDLVRARQAASLAGLPSSTVITTRRTTLRSEMIQPLTGSLTAVRQSLNTWMHSRHFSSGTRM
jgi:transposase